MPLIRYLVAPMLLLSIISEAQPTFKAGWSTYNTGVIIHEYTYHLNTADSNKLVLADSINTLVSSDSLVAMSVHYSPRERCNYKTVRYLNIRKLVIKQEDYKDENLTESNEWKYDDKGRKIMHVQDDKIRGNVYKKLYEYSNDKKSGDVIVTESAYQNGRIEFYTKSYIDKNNLKYKEVRLNDNNKDVVHIESFFYGENGKVKERSVYFPEWKVTKKFEEPAGNVPVKCFKLMPLGTLEKPTATTPRIPYIKKVLTKNNSIVSDRECDDYHYKFTNNSNCEMIVTPLKVNKLKQVVFRIKEKVS